MKKFTIFIFTLAFTLSLWGSPTSQSKSDYSVALDSTTVSVDANGSGTFSIVKEIKINTTKGALANRVVVYDYDPLTAFAEFKYVRIIRKDGSVEELDVAKANDYVAPARAIYWGARQIMIEVGRLYPGDELRYEIAKKGFTYALLTADFAPNDDDARFIPPMRGEFYDIVPFWRNVPTEKLVYKMSIPMEKEVQFKFYYGECSSSMEYVGERKIYTFSSTDIAPFVSEPNMVSPFDAAPKLFLSSTPNWKEKSLWFNKVNEDYGSFEAYAPAQKKVDELIKGKTNEMDKIAVLTHWVADNIRYSGITMGEGEGFTLHNTKMNYTDRCGVCKDIAGTLISFLRMAGFEAFPAMTMAGSRVEAIPADHFNHCVAVVKLSTGVYIPLDPTWVPFTRELWSSAEQQQNYLPGVTEGSDLLITPISPAKDHYFRIAAKSSIDEKGTLTGEFTVSAEGQSDRAIRRIFTSGWQSQWFNSLEEEILAVSPKAKIVSIDYGKDPKNYQAGPISITYKYVIPDYALVGDGVLIFKPVVMNNLYRSIRSFERINLSSEVKKYGFKDACSRLVQLDEVITLPKGYNMVNQTKEEQHVSAVASFSGSISQVGGAIKLTQELSLNKRVYEATDWNDFKSAVSLYKEFGDNIIIKK